jgi:hypothetical protein
MIYCGGEDDKPESYSAYKNRVFKKHLDKLTNQLRQISDCSLHGDDKIKLRKQLSDLLTPNPRKGIKQIV